MSAQSRWNKLEPRERKLVLAFLGLVSALVFLGIPLLVRSFVASKREANQEIRDLIATVYEARTTVDERRAKHDALLMRYARQAPPLAGFIEEKARSNSLTAAESQDKPEVPHGKRYSERITVVKMHKANMLPLLNMLQQIEQSNLPVAVTKLNIKPRQSEPDSYEVEVGVSAYDRKKEAPPPAASGSAAASAHAEDRR